MSDHHIWDRLDEIKHVLTIIMFQLAIIVGLMVGQVMN